VSVTHETDPGPALLVIDVQAGFDDPVWGPRNNPNAEANIARLLGTWRGTHLPLVIVVHDSTEPTSPLRPGQLGNAVRGFVEGPADIVIHKNVNSAFYGEPDLDEWLRARNIGEVVICGVTTNHCCETTARMAGNLGYTVTFVIDATHTFDRVAPDGTVISAEDIARVTAANLHGEFATVVTTQSVLARLS
jgi:nicotinamidase-related amidase